MDLRIYETISGAFNISGMVLIGKYMENTRKEQMGAFWCFLVV